jgi:hypothetical protein
VVPTRRSNCSHSTNFCASPQDNVSRQTLIFISSTSPGSPTRLLDLAVPNYFLWDYIKSKVYETHPANIDDLKQQILECIQGKPKAMLQRVMTAFPSQLKECINDMVVKNKVSHSNSNDSDEFSWTWNAPDGANKIFPLCLTKLFHFKNC